MHAAAAARAPLVDAKETDEAGDALKAEVCGTGAGASMDAVAAAETIQQEAADTSELVSKLKKNDAKLQHLLREQHLRRVSLGASSCPHGKRIARISSYPTA